jgi:hypothetical protein
MEDRSEIKTQEFGKLPPGHKFFLNNPVGLPANAYYVKIATIKDTNGTWANATTAFGSPKIFVQYDRRIWLKHP